MRKPYALTVEAPEGITCEIVGTAFTCKKDSDSLQRKITMPGTTIKINGNAITFDCKKANKKDIAVIKAHASHVQNMFKGLSEPFTYELEICNVHFPITAKVENDNVTISNFLGEKVNRHATILPGVTVDIKGQKITVTGNDIEKTGQTAANIEKAAVVTNRDRRIFQDGIFMTSKPGGAI